MNVPPAIMTRRQLLGVGAVGISTLALASCAPGTGGSSSGGAQSLRVHSYEDPFASIIQESILDRFTQQHSDVQTSLFIAPNSTAYPQLGDGKSAPAFDVGMWNDGWAATGASEGRWQDVAVQGSDRIVSSLNAAKIGTTFGVTAFGLAYNPKFVDAPTSWADLYDPVLKGKVGLWDVFFDWLIMASVIEGGDERNLEPGFAAWAKAKGNVGLWTDSLPVLHQALHAGDIWIAADWASFALAARATGQSVEFVIPDEGATQASVILELNTGVDGEKKELATELMGLYLTEEFQLQMAEKTFYSPVIEGLQLPGDIASLGGMITAAEAEQQLRRYDYAYIGGQFDHLYQRITGELK